VFLSLVDLEAATISPSGWVLDVETTCLNRDLPKRLPYGGGRPALRLPEGGPFARISCLTPPTATLRSQPRKGALWRVISHLSLNHLSICHPAESPEGLKEVLKLYDFTDSAETRSKIDGLLKVASRRVSRPLRSDRGSEFCRGVEIQLQFDGERFSDNSLYLFASVLERFLALYCSVNSFSQVAVSLKDRKGFLRTWPPRAGDRLLL
jgi:type VI secretion system protein ImpG